MRTLIFIASAFAVALISGWGALGVSEYYNLAFAGQADIGSYLSESSAALFGSPESYCSHCLGFGLAYLASGAMGMFFLFQRTASGVLLSSLIGGGILLFESILLSA